MKVTKSYLKQIIKEEMQKISEVSRTDSLLKYVQTPEEFNSKLDVDQESGEVMGESFENFSELANLIKTKIGDIESLLVDIKDDYAQSYKPEAYSKMYEFMRVLEETYHGIESFRNK